MRLENWFVTTDGGLYDAPELRRTFLVGEVYGSDKHEDGKVIQTFSIKGITDEGDIITNSDNEYELGNPDPNYEKKYKNAKERVISTIMKKRR